jgi:hypothetical protein
MIHRLRRRHRGVWLVLAVVVPLLYIFALTAREPAPIVPSLPELVRGATSELGGAP